MKKYVVSKQRFFIEEVDGDVLDSDIITISQEQYDQFQVELSAGGKQIGVVDGKLALVPIPRYTDEFYAQVETNSNAVNLLASGDWKVIRELERKFLADTELHAEREALRASVVVAVPIFVEQ